MKVIIVSLLFSFSLFCNAQNIHTDTIIFETLDLALVEGRTEIGLTFKNSKGDVFYYMEFEEYPVQVGDITLYKTKPDWPDEFIFLEENAQKVLGEKILLSYKTGENIMGEIRICTNMEFIEAVSKSKDVSIGSQIWMAENLDLSTFRNGDPILHAKTDYEWKEAEENGQPAWCYYDNDPSNGDKYGKLYNWHAVNDPRGLAPVGWHIPSEPEWEQLIDYLGGQDIAGAKMKTTNGWSNSASYPNGNGTNESGFSGLPGGKRNNKFKGGFRGIGFSVFWWSSEFSGELFSLSFSNEHVRYEGKSHIGGAYVRCIKD